MVYTSSPTSISSLKEATPIRLIEGGVDFPKIHVWGHQGEVESPLSRSERLSSSYKSSASHCAGALKGFIDTIRVVDMLDSSMANQFGAGSNPKVSSSLAS